MTSGNVSTKTRAFGRKATDSDLLEHAVRVGLVAYGVVHLLIAWLAVQLAFGSHAGSASGTGALSELAQKPFGQVLLWVVGLGFLALVVWQLLETLAGHRSRDGLKRTVARLRSAGRTIVYAALGISALKIVIGSGSGGSEDTDTLTSRLMSLPLGVVLVAAVGVVIWVVAGAHIYRGLAEKFRDELEAPGKIGHTGRLYIGLGKVGYVSKGLALFVVGALFVYAAWTHDPAKSGGLDQALRTVLNQPFGAPLLVLIAVGLGCFGLFCFAWARHVDL